MSFSAVIIDDNVVNRILLRTKLAAFFADIVVSPSAEAVRQLPLGHIPTVVIAPDRFDVCRLWGCKSSGLMDADAPVAVIRTPCPEDELQARARAALRIARRRSGYLEQLGTGGVPPLASLPQPTVTLIMGDHRRGALLARNLSHATGFKCWPHPPHRDFETADEELLEAYVLEASSCRYDSLELISALRARANSTIGPAIVAFGEGLKSGQAARLLDAGADDVIDCGAGFHGLADSLTSVCSRRRELFALQRMVSARLREADFDPLTGVLNRRSIRARLRQWASEREGQPVEFSAAIFDVDHFKTINDSYGHAAGDAVLCALSARISGMLPDGAVLARVGGEEFLAVLPGGSSPAARAFATEVCKAVAERPFRLPEGLTGPPVSLSVSAGVAAWAQNPLPASQCVQAVDRVVQAADEALYAAKAAGRNRVCLGQAA